MINNPKDCWGLGSDARTGVWHFFPATRSLEGKQEQGTRSICGQQNELLVPWNGPGAYPHPDGPVGICKKCIALKIELWFASQHYISSSDHLSTEWE